MKGNKEIITKTIKELGIPANLKGYHYISCGVEMIINEFDLIYSTTRLYGEVAKRFDTTQLRVERGIRNAKEIGWKRANIEFANKLFGYSIDANKGIPTNSEFLATIADYIFTLLNRPDEKGGENNA